jgi:DNA-binding NarL/FixJ family response regulator
VESDDTNRRFMAAVVAGTPGLSNPWACATGRDALSSLGRCPAEVVLASLFLRDMTGGDFILQARRLRPGSLFVLLVPEAQPHLLMQALETGAGGYLSKPCGADELIKAVWTVRQGGAVISNVIAKTVVDYFGARGSVLTRLTDRERQVLNCLSSGLSHAEISVQFGIDRETVRSHVRNVLTKLDAHSTVEAIALYLNPKLPGSANATGNNRLSRPNASP